MTSRHQTNAKLMRVAIVGSGPSGIYSIEHLTRELGDQVAIDVYERLPTPWGLVRSAVAPDHQMKKQVIDSCFARAFNKSQVRYFGNVEVGKHISHEEISAWYDAVIYASGANGDIRMSIPGEELPGSHAAREFVHWYNGHPDFSALNFDLSAKRAVIVGNGNVALDVARILTLTESEMKSTDMADYAIEALAKSNIEEIVILGRRGHLQGAFHNSELEELEHLEGVAVDLVGETLLPLSSPQAAKLDFSSKRKLVTLHRLNQRKVNNPRKRIVLQFLASPVEITGQAKAEQLTIVANELKPNSAGKLTAVATDKTSVLATSLILRSIGFKGQRLTGLPFDEQKNVLPNNAGRLIDQIADDDIKVLHGLYVTGWLKRGPRGLIGTNKACALETVECLLDDWQNNKLVAGNKPLDKIPLVIKQRQPKLIERDQWWLIDSFERATGGITRPRCKITNHQDLLDCAFGRHAFIHVA